VRLVKDAASVVVFVLGLAAVTFGAWLAWHPAGFIVGGSLGAFFAWLYAETEPEADE
jgi:hypothetical protein